MDQIRDLLHVLTYVIEKTQIETTDSVRSAINRLRQATKTEQESSAQLLIDLKARRSALIPQRFRLADQKRHLDFVVAQPQAHATPTQRAEAKRRADHANAEYDAVCKELASVEAAIAAVENKEAA